MIKIDYVPSKSHWLVPPIIMGILAILLVIMMIERYFETKKSGKPFINLSGYRFFKENWDKLRLIGGLLLFVIYIKAMDFIGFLPASIICIFLFNVLFTGVKELKEAAAGVKEKTFYRNSGFKSVANSIIISTVFAVGVWFIFGQVFQITLP